ncbi:hypothetical protein E4U15_005375 [Claviceps sp. LM218 group G6]|nr:hypothetical protein E4U15_005375 [Claviceps sp. LM218 group G6]
MDKAREAYLNRPTCFASPAATEESRFTNQRRHPSRRRPPARKVGRPVGSRNRTQIAPTQIVTRLIRATSERAQLDQSIPATQQPPASTADSTATGTVATQRL